MANRHSSFRLSSKGLAALGLIGAVTYFLLVEHQEHVWQFLPYLIFLACPLMHLFMHRGHGHSHSRGDGHAQAHHEHDDDPSDSARSEDAAYRRGLEEGRREKQTRHGHTSR